MSGLGSGFGRAVSVVRLRSCGFGRDEKRREVAYLLRTYRTISIGLLKHIYFRPEPADRRSSLGEGVLVDRASSPLDEPPTF